MRGRLQLELIRRFETNEREGHLEDLMIATILDPRQVKTILCDFFHVPSLLVII